MRSRTSSKLWEDVGAKTARTMRDFPTARADVWDCTGHVLTRWPRSCPSFIAMRVLDIRCESKLGDIQTLLCLLVLRLPEVDSQSEHSKLSTAH